MKTAETAEARTWGTTLCLAAVAGLAAVAVILSLVVRDRRGDLLTGSEPIGADWVHMPMGSGNEHHSTFTLINNVPWHYGHLQGLNGLTHYIHRSDPRDVFTPRHSGLNFEFLYDGVPDDPRCDDPRQGRWTLHRFARNTVALHQRASDSAWGVEGLMRFRRASPEVVDMDVTLWPRRAAFRAGWLLAFWATYIHAPEDRAMYFLGRREDEPGEAVRWIRAESPAHGVEACHRSADETEDPLRDAPREHLLTRWFTAYSPYVYEWPFFYGRRGPLVIILMVHTRDLPPGSVLRFWQSPNSGDLESIDPAWDFYVVIRDVRPGTPYRLQARLVVKEWAGRDDVIRAYETWSGRAVPRPAVEE